MPNKNPLFKPLRAEQHHARDLDINEIVRRASPRPQATPQTHVVWGSWSSSDSFLKANQAVINARDAFMTLPVRVRAQFNNRPENLLSFLQDSRNRDRAIALGLVEPSEEDLKKMDKAKNDRAEFLEWRKKKREDAAAVAVAGK
jgi:hypothetical protein